MLVRVLGPIDVVASDGRVVPLMGTRPALLLALLASNAPAAVANTRLAEAMWGDEQPVDPVGALQSQITRLRRRLGAAEAIETVAGGYRLAHSDVDAVFFERRVREADALAPYAALEQLEAGLSLWRGQAFGELAEHNYLRAVAARLEERRNLASEARAAALLRIGRGGEAVAAAAGLARDQPLREAPRALLMTALTVCGRQAEALDVYRDFCRTLRDEVGLDPSPALADLERRILRHEPLPSAADDSLPARLPRRPSGQRSLPEFATSFVGRGPDIAALHEMLAAGRLVTVVGPGGVGKTRLAVEAARTLTADAFPDGTWFVDLTSVRHPDGVVETIAASLGIERRSGIAGVARLAEALSTQRSLLLVDNCEHVLGTAADVIDELIAHTTAVAVLATSRARLGVAAERCHLVAPLITPDADRAVGSAAELFLDRAQAACQDFSLDPAAEVAVCALCRHLDGLPLAIELTAMSLNAFTPLEILSDLEARMRMPERRGRDTRHRSMEAVVAWSYDLLDDTDRRCFENLAVFVGGFTREAAAPVAELAAAEAAVRVSGLVDRSLVSATPATGTMRYRMLEPVRAFAENLLDARGGSPAARGRHAAWFIEFAGAAGAGLCGPDEKTWAERLDVELGNLRAAFRHLVERDNFSGCLRLLAPLFWYVWSSAHSEVGTWAEEAVGRSRDRDHPLFSTVCAAAAVAAWQRGDSDIARTLAQRGIDAATGEPARARYAIDTLGDVCLLHGDNRAAIRLYREGIALARQADDAKHVVIGSCNLALGFGYSGDVEAAIGVAGEAQELAHVTANPSNVAFATFVRGEVLGETSPEKALPLLNEAVVAAGIAGNRLLMGVAGLSAVSVAARVGDPGDMLARYPPLLDHFQRSGAWTQLWMTVRTLIETLVRAGRAEPAATLLGALQATKRAGPLIGADADRLASAERTIRAQLGDAECDGLKASGAAMGDAPAVDFARAILAL
ncbi:MAG: BTAD domain-containing putative transcriptional regulator [Candidatus Dormibacteria bacterium]